MKVRELVELLGYQDQELDLVISGYEGGYRDLQGVNELELALNVNTAWYYGPHELPQFVDPDEVGGYKTKKSIVIF